MAHPSPRIRDFWQMVLPIIAKEHPQWAGRQATDGYWLHTPTGVRNLRYYIFVRKDDAGCGLTIAVNSGKSDWNKSVFDALKNNRAQIEKVFGESLLWQRLDNKKMSAIEYIAAKDGYQASPLKWPGVAKKLIEKVRLFEAAFQPHLQAACLPRELESAGQADQPHRTPPIDVLTNKYSFFTTADETTEGDLIEGAVRRTTVNAYERSTAARQRCIAHWKSRCFCCNLDMGERYGPIANGYIHVHHLKRLATIG